jgi:formylglycine-generating enzyme required for sulfatase activity/predicted CoA-binding protein
VKVFLQTNDLTSGQHGNALDCYNDYLSKNPNNQKALNGLKTIEFRFVHWAKKAIKRKDKNKLAEYLQKLTKINRQSQNLKQLKTIFENQFVKKHFIKKQTPSPVTSTTDKAIAPVTLSNREQIDPHIPQPELKFIGDYNNDGVFNRIEIAKGQPDTLTLAISFKQVGTGDKIIVNGNEIALTTIDRTLGRRLIEVIPAQRQKIQIKRQNGQLSTTATINSVIDTDTISGKVSINDITEDNIINQIEATQTITIHGQAIGGDISIGDKVSIQLNGKTYSSFIEKQGLWNIPAINGTELIRQKFIQAQVESMDEHGNILSSLSPEKKIYVDINVATPKIEFMGDSNGDGVFNKAEIAIWKENTISAKISFAEAQPGDQLIINQKIQSLNARQLKAGQRIIQVLPNQMLSVSILDQAGNQSTEIKSKAISVTEATPGIVSIDNITIDNSINAKEARQLLNISGHAEGGAISPGDKVTLSIKGKMYRSKVQSDGSWLFPAVPGAILAKSKQIQVKVQSHDPYGNPGLSQSAPHHYQVDTQIGTLTPQLLGDSNQDGLFNRAEIAADNPETIRLKLEFHQVQLDDTLIINGVPLKLSAEDLKQGYKIVDINPYKPVTVQLRDPVNNFSALLSITPSVDTQTQAGQVSIHPISDDNILNAKEIEGFIRLSGTAQGGDIAPGDQVIININNTHYTTQVGRNGQWQLKHFAGQNLASASRLSVQVNSMDAAGNPLTSHSPLHHYDIDTDIQSPRIELLGDSNQDGVFNRAELAAGKANTLSAKIYIPATTSGDTLTINGKSQTLNQQDIDRGYVAYDFPSSQNLKVFLSDIAGNHSDTIYLKPQLDIETIPGTISIDSLTADNQINYKESQQLLWITGSAQGGDISEGDRLELNLPEHRYQTQIGENGQWQLQVPGSVLMAHRQFDVQVFSQDEHGNSLSSKSPPHKYRVDTEIATPSILFLGDKNADGVFNQAEIARGRPDVIGAKVSFETAQVGDILSVNEKQYRISRALLQKAYVIYAVKPEHPVVAQLTDQAGNQSKPVQASALSDTQATPGLVTINPITSDNIINAIEVKQSIAISGRAQGGDISPGDKVGLSIKGKSYRSKVQSDGSWLFPAIPGAILAKGKQIQVKVQSHDPYGNPGLSQSAPYHYQMDTQIGSLTPQLLGDSNQDGVFNRAEIAADNPKTIALKLLFHQAQLGDALMIDGKPQVLSAEELKQGYKIVNINPYQTISVQLRDTANNHSPLLPITPRFDIQTQAGQVSIHPISDDNILNAEEIEGFIRLSGTAQGGDIAPGDQVIININNTHYTTQVGRNGQWQLKHFAGQNLASASRLSVQVNSMDAAGNPLTSHSLLHHYDIDTDIQSPRVELLGDSNQDGVFNRAELAAGKANTLSAKIYIPATTSGDTLTINGKSQTLNQQDIDRGYVAYDFPSSQNLKVFLSDKAGNHSDTIHLKPQLDIETIPGTLSIDSLTADNQINYSESQQSLWITGSAQGGDISEGDRLALNLPEHRYQTQIGENGQWQLQVPGSVLMAHRQFDVQVFSQDEHGNSLSSKSPPHKYRVDTEIATPSILFLGDKNADGVFNQAEIARGRPDVIGAKVSFETAQVGDILSVNEKQYRITRALLQKAYVIYAVKPDTPVIAQLKDRAGNQSNTVQATSLSDILATPGTISINNITADNIIDTNEANQNIIISGHAGGGDISSGDKVSFTLNHKTYTTQVQADGTWSKQSVAGKDLIQDLDFFVQVDSQDEYENKVSSKSAIHLHRISDKLKKRRLTATIPKTPIVNLNSLASYGIDMVEIKGTCFNMGSSAMEAGHQEDETPYRICLDNFKINKTPVSVAAFNRFIKASNYRTDAEKQGITNLGCFSLLGRTKEEALSWVENFNYSQPGFVQGPDHPVVCISYNDITHYLQWLNKNTGLNFRLPTEAEWELAARGGEKGPRFWGKSIEHTCNFANVATKVATVGTMLWEGAHPCFDGYHATSPIASYPSNPYGLYDMLGNVWEWTCSAYKESYDSSVNQCNQKANIKYTIRGASWLSGINSARVANREWLYGNERSTDQGFRLVQTD